MQDIRNCTAGSTTVPTGALLLDILQVTKERLEGMQEKLSKAQLDKMGLEQKVGTHWCCQTMFAPPGPWRPHQQRHC
jgi:hypothetical protein